MKILRFDACAILLALLLAIGVEPLGAAAPDSIRLRHEQEIQTLRSDWRAGKLADSSNEYSTRAVETCREWLDLLEDEGCIHPGGFTDTPLDMKNAMTLAGKQSDEHSPELSHTLDQLIGRLDRFSSAWFADGTAGDISNHWIAPHRWTLRSHDAHTLVLSSDWPDGICFDLTLTAYEGGVYRIHGPIPGFFKPDALVPADLNLTQDANRITLHRPEGDMLICLDPPRIQIARGARILWEADAVELLPDPQHPAAVQAIRLRSTLNDQDHCFGLGERFGALDHRGRVVTQWTTDAIFSAVRGRWTETYRPAPWIVDPRGVSTFFNTQSLSRLDLGAADPSQQDFVAPGPVFDAYLFMGDPKTAIRGYTRLTGQNVEVPAWALTPWMGGGTERWNINGPAKACDEVRQVVERMRELDIPHGAIYIEGIATYKPEGKALVNWLLKERNLKPLVWYGPNSGGKETFDFKPEELDHLFIKDADGSVFHVPKGRFLGGDRYIDFTNPASIELLDRRYKWNLDAGVRGCMIDGGEEIPQSPMFAGDFRPDAMHNLYPLFYHRAHQAEFNRRLPDDHILFVRSGAPGDQSSCAQFLGDLPGDYGGLTAAIHAGLSCSSSGFGVWGSDIGGYFTMNHAPLSKEVFLRWQQFGTFSPLDRVHGQSPREPWIWDEETIATYRSFCWLRMNLLPYLSAAAHNQNQGGVPMVLPLPIEYPNDATAMSIDDEYLLGPDLLVAPVHSAENVKAVYLPPGIWYDLFADFSPVQGGRTVHPLVPLSQIPVYVRAGAILPFDVDARWRLAESMKSGSRRVLFLLPDPDGGQSSAAGVKMRREGDDLLVTATISDMLRFCIPVAKKCTVSVDHVILDAAARFSMDDTTASNFFDAPRRRHCIQVRLAPAGVLRLQNYFSNSGKDSSAIVHDRVDLER